MNNFYNIKSRLQTFTKYSYIFQNFQVDLYLNTIRVKTNESIKNMNVKDINRLEKLGWKNFNNYYWEYEIV